MKRLIVTFVMLVALMPTTIAQIGKSLPCISFNTIFSNKEIKEHFDFRNTDTVLIVDTFGLLVHCNSETTGKQIVSVVNKIPDEAKKGDRSYKAFKERKNFKVIIIQKARLVNNIYAIRLWQVNDNSTTEFELRQGKNKTKIKVISLGVY